MSSCGLRGAISGAIRLGELTRLKTLFENGCVPNDYPLNDLLCVAVELDHVDIVEYLLDQGANVNPPDPFFLPLHRAVIANNANVVKLLLARGADVKGLDEDKQEPIHLAAAENNTGIAQILLDSGADVEAKAVGFRSSTPLHQAAENNSAEAAQFFLDQGASINAIDIFGHTPVHYAFEHNFAEAAVVQVLLNHGPINNLIGYYGDGTFLHTASNYNLGAVKMFLDKGADIEATNHNGDTPLHEACLYGKYECVLLLLDRRANLNALNKYGRSPLHAAVVRFRAATNREGLVENAAIIRLLVNRGSDVDVTDADGRTPLYLVNLSNRPLCRTRIAKQLLDLGANVNVADAKGKTPLHAAAVAEPLSTLRLLINRGANLDAIDNLRMTALADTITHRTTNSLKLLLSHDADVNIPDDEGRTALHLALKSDHEKHLETQGGRPGGGGVRVPARPVLRRGYTLPVDEPYHPFWLRVAQNRRTDDDTDDDEEEEDDNDDDGDDDDGDGQGCRILKILLNTAAGLNLEAADNSGRTTLHNAAALGNEQAVQLLLDKGANPEAVDATNATPLHHASENGKEQTAQILLGKGANLEAVDVDNMTPLLLAAENGNERLVQLLLGHGANLEAVDAEKWTPLHWAAQNGNEQAVRLLLGKAANPEAVDVNNWTPLYYAAVKGHLDLVRYLTAYGVPGLVAHNASTAFQMASDDNTQHVVASQQNGQQRFWIFDCCKCFWTFGLW